MNIIPIPAFKDNYIWLIVDENNNLAYCVDPGDAKPVIEFVSAKGLSLKAVLLTHHHWDHTGGVADLLSHYKALAVYGPDDSRIPTVNHLLTANTKQTIFSQQFLILPTPGHTSTHISLYEPKHKWLFCGDTLFSGGCGRVFDGTYEQLYDSLNLLKHLPPTTEIFCAHEYTRQNLRFAAMLEPKNQAIKRHAAQLANSLSCSLPSTIALEKEINPFLRTDCETLKDYARCKGLTSADPFDIFKQIRLEKDSFI